MATMDQMRASLEKLRARVEKKRLELERLQHQLAQQESTVRLREEWIASLPEENREYAARVHRWGEEPPEEDDSW